MVSLNAFGNGTEHCLEFSKKIADVIFDLKIALGSLGILLSLFAIVLITLSRIYKQFVYRLVMYLMAVNVTQALCQIIELIPVKVTDDERIIMRNGTGWEEVCAVLGYLDIVTAWMGNLVIIWIMLYMLTLSWQLHRLQSRQHTTRPPTSNMNKNSHTREIIGVLLLVFSPFLFSWIPFVVHMYGISGLWCWIKTASDNGCNDTNFQHLSLTLMMVMFYGPLMGILIFGLVCMLSIIILLGRSSKNLHGAVRQRYRSSMKEIGLVLIYPIVYCLFCFLLLVNRIYSSAHTNSNDKPNSYPLWVIHAVADPGRILIPALAFLLHPHVWKNVLACRGWSKNAESTCNTKYSVPPEGDDIKGYTIRPSDGGYGSTTSSLLFPKANGK